MNGRKPYPVLLAAIFVAALARAESAPQPAASPAFARLQALAGEWVAADDSEMVKKGELVARYALTAGGSAVVETIFPGSPHEMVTVYTEDGEDVVLHHYCLNANAPRMRAKAPAPDKAGGTAGGRYEFAFDGGSNIHSPHDKHMHSAWIEFVSKNELRSEWTELDGGKTAMVVTMHPVRKSNG